MLIQENKLLSFYRDHLDAGVQKLEQGLLALASGLGRFGFRPLDRVVNPMIWVVDLSASYLDLFELLREEMPSETAIMRISRQETSFHFNPFLLADPLLPVAEDQFEFCMGLLKLIAGTKLATPSNEIRSWPRGFQGNSAAKSR